MNKPIRRACVIGAGVMGSGIAAHFANAGVSVVLLDIVPPNLTEAEAKSRTARNRFSAGGLEKALTRRPVPAGAADAAADAIEAELRSQGINEVDSAIVGQMAMERLRAIDQIGYIRFMSVYQSLSLIPI